MSGFCDLQKYFDVWLYVLFFFPPAKIDTSWLLPYLFGTIPQSYLRGCIPGYHCSLIAQSCLTLCDPTDYSPLGSSLHGISQIRILEWVAISFSRGSSWPRDWTQVSSISCIDRWILYQWATREAPSSAIFLNNKIVNILVIHFFGGRGFPDSSVGKESACNAGDPGSIPGSGRSTGEGIGYSLQYSWASLVALLVKNLPAIQETWVQSLG